MRIFVAIVSLLFPLFLQSQDINTQEEYRVIDSIKKILTQENIEKNRSNYIKIITFYARKNIDSSKTYVKKYTKLTENSPARFDAITRKIYLLQLEKKYEEAEALIHTTIQKDSIVLNQPENKRALLKFYLSLAEIYMDTYANEKALETYYKTAAIYESEGMQDDINYFVNLSSISAILFNLKYHKRAIEYLDKMETLLLKKIASIDRKDLNYEGFIYVQINAYINRSLIHKNLEEIPKAIMYAKKAEALCIAEKQQRLLPKIYIVLGNMHLATETYNSALENFKKAIAVEKLYNYPEFRYFLFYKAGYACLQLKSYDQAISYLETGLEKTNIAAEKIPLLSDLAKAYQGSKKYKKATETFVLYNQLKDSVDSQNQEEAIAEITEKYENEKKQKQITILNSEKALQQLKIEQQSYIIYGIIGLVILLFILGIVWYKNRQQQQKLKEAILNLDKEKLQQRFLRTQLNPHFFFHALTAIESHIYKEDKETAAVFLQKFGALMRTILESSDIDFIPLDTDINFIKKYLTLQSLNNPSNFTHDVKVSEELNLSNTMIPPMLIQPFVENAILHGVSSVENGHITIEYSKQESDLLIAIKDNGKGITTMPKKSGMLHRSMSTDIIKQRIENIQKVHKMKIQYEVSSVENTTVIFRIPIKYGNFRVA